MKSGQGGELLAGGAINSCPGLLVCTKEFDKIFGTHQMWCNMGTKDIVGTSEYKMRFVIAQEVIEYCILYKLGCCERSIILCNNHNMIHDGCFFGPYIIYYITWSAPLHWPGMGIIIPDFCGLYMNQYIVAGGYCRRRYLARIRRATELLNTLVKEH